MIPVLEAVPNVSEGRDPGVHRALVEVVEEAGAELLDWSADRDHHRCVLTYVGTSAEVEAASLAVARVAMDAVDLRRHRGVHPRIGALDVLPFVPLAGLTMADAVGSAHRVARGLALLGLPVYLYGAASDPPGRGLAELRRGGFEALAAGFPPGRRPDLLPPGWVEPGVHPGAGAVCVGARGVLLAWNVTVREMSLESLRELAARLRERGGGFPGLRTLAITLPGSGWLQLSMNLEDPLGVSPFEVYAAIEQGVASAGGVMGETEVIGLVPEALVLPSAADRLRLRDGAGGRLLSDRLGTHVRGRVEREVRRFLDVLRDSGPDLPDEVRAAAGRLERTLEGQPERRDHRG